MIIREGTMKTGDNEHYHWDCNAPDLILMLIVWFKVFIKENYIICDMVNQFWKRKQITLSSKIDTRI
jgi:hypothetical protein